MKMFFYIRVKAWIILVIGKEGITKIKPKTAQ